MVIFQTNIPVPYLQIRIVSNTSQLVSVETVYVSSMTAINVWRGKSFGSLSGLNNGASTPMVHKKRCYCTTPLNNCSKAGDWPDIQLVTQPDSKLGLAFICILIARQICNSSPIGIWGCCYLRNASFHVSKKEHSISDLNMLVLESVDCHQLVMETRFRQLVLWIGPAVNV